ncbi:hypothetical protein [Leuconostoc gelidum]|uniref:Uncharacterized protein n=1 Tax=Leuconostoc gelidum subsp. gelidum TaxID=1607839 RepID=A0AB35FXQ5_LEUGE|nr:hypothetical protein [Leuconostoc gelidum]MBZ6015417.1 hypothetical protein [Leuconostoc gelidum subsp. gelidum]
MIKYIVSEDKVPHKESLGRMSYNIAVAVQELIGGEIYSVDDVTHTISKIRTGDRRT